MVTLAGFRSWPCCCAAATSSGELKSISATPPRMPMVEVGVLNSTGLVLLMRPPTKRNTPLVTETASVPVLLSGS